MDTSIQIVKARIARDERIDFRGTPYAKFSYLAEGAEYYMVEAWFIDGQPRMQIRSSAEGLEEAAVVAQCIQMAIDWFSEKVAANSNLIR